MSQAARLVLAAFLVGGCAPRRTAAPVPEPARSTAPTRFAVLGNASPADSGPPTLRLEAQVVTIRGTAVQVDGGSIYGDVDLTQPHTLRLTLYDSLPGRPVQDPVPPSRSDRQVVWEARIGPLPAGPYEVWVGRFDPRARLVEVAHQPLHIEVKRAIGRDSASSTPDSSSR